MPTKKTDEEETEPERSEETKAELQAELDERGLPTSGNKADLVARLEEADDPSVSTRGTGPDPTAPYEDPHQQRLHPMELPANPAAAANYQGVVDPDKEISEERIAQGQAAIQAEQERIAGQVIEDPRLADPNADPTVPPEEAEV